MSYLIVNTEQPKRLYIFKHCFISHIIQRKIISDQKVIKHIILLETSDERNQCTGKEFDFSRVGSLEINYTSLMIK